MKAENQSPKQTFNNPAVDLPGAVNKISLLEKATKNIKSTDEVYMLVKSKSRAF